MKVVYVAGKFRGENAWEVHKNVEEALKIGFEVAALGAMPLIPHANGFQFDGTLDDQFWLDGAMELLRRCDAVMTVDNWTMSKGAKDEVVEAVDKLGIPVFHELSHLVEWLASLRGQVEEPKLHVCGFYDDADVPSVMLCGKVIHHHEDGSVDANHDFDDVSFFAPEHASEDLVAHKISEVTCPTCRDRVQKIADARFEDDEKLSAERGRSP
jgi:hypothetical protein